MNPVVEKRRAAIVTLLYYTIILALFYLFFKMVFPLLFPFIFAFIVASVFNRPVSYIAEKTKIKRSFLSVLFVLLLLGLCLCVFFLIGVGIFEKIKGFYQFIISKFQNLSELFNDIKLWILSVTDFLPEAIRNVLHENVTLFFDSIIENGLNGISMDAFNIDWGHLLTKGGRVLTGTVAHIPAVLIACVVSIISCVFVISDYDKIKQFFTKQLSDKNAKRIKDGCKLGVSSLKKMLKAYFLIILITFSELSLGLYIFKWFGIFKSQYIFLIAAIIAIIDIIPVLGTGTILIPWAVYSFLAGSVPLGIGLIVMYAVILVIRQIIEPKIVAGQVGLPPIVTIIAMYIGTKTLGVLGFFILPFCVVLVKVFNDAGLIHVFKDVIDEKAVDSENGLDEKNAENSAE